MERRFAPKGDIEVRANDDKVPEIAGHSAVFDQWTDIGPFREKIAPGAFARSIESDDVLALFNHNPDRVLGRTSAGTLELREDKEGLFMRAFPPTSEGGLMESIDRGDITGQSFGFQVIADEWHEADDGVEERTIREAKLFDVGPVTFPAYKQTDIAVRSAQEVYEQHTQTSEVPDSAGAEEEGEETVESHRADSRYRKRKIRRFRTVRDKGE